MIITADRNIRFCSFIGNEKIVKGNTGLFASPSAISEALPNGFINNL
jgi:hypothetical protein